MQMHVETLEQMLTMLNAAETFIFIDQRRVKNRDFLTLCNRSWTELRDELKRTLTKETFWDSSDEDERGVKGEPAFIFKTILFDQHYCYVKIKAMSENKIDVVSLHLDETDYRRKEADLMLSEDTGFCTECQKRVAYDTEREEVTRHVGDERLTAVVERAYCSECGEPLEIETIKKNNQIIFNRLYQKKKGLLIAKEIIRIRKQRKLAQAELADLIGMREKDLIGLENGTQIQQRNTDILLRLVKDEDGFKLLKKINGKE